MTLGKLPSLPEPLPDNGPHRRAFSFKITSATSPLSLMLVTGSIYCVRTHRVRAKGGEYILAAGTGEATRYAIVNVQRAMDATLYGMIYGWNRRRTRFGKTIPDTALKAPLTGAFRLDAPALRARSPQVRCIVCSLRSRHVRSYRRERSPALRRSERGFTWHAFPGHLTKRRANRRPIPNRRRLLPCRRLNGLPRRRPQDYRGEGRVHRDWEGQSMLKATALALALALLAAPAALCQPVAVDGDTLKADGVTWRLWGIDAPELRQTCADGWQAGIEAAAAPRVMLAASARPWGACARLSDPLGMAGSAPEWWVKWWVREPVVNQIPIK